MIEDVWVFGTSFDAPAILQTNKVTRLMASTTLSSSIGFFLVQIKTMRKEPVGV
jgi:hypothetical protein